MQNVKLVENHLTSQLFSMRYRHAVHCLRLISQRFACIPVSMLGFFPNCTPVCIVDGMPLSYVRWSSIIPDANLFATATHYAIHVVHVNMQSIQQRWCHTITFTCYLTTIWSGTSFSEFQFRLMHDIMIPSNWYVFSVHSKCAFY